MKQGDFTAITATGDRPEVLAICGKLMSRQRLQPAEWIVVDDGVIASEPPDLPYVKYLRREPRKDDPDHTLGVQLRYAFPHVSTDKIAMIEDDDWYHPFYLWEMMQHLDEFNLVGHTHNVYYFVEERRFHIHQNDRHSSMCSTVFRSELIRAFDDLSVSNPYVDMELWRYRKTGPKHLYRPEILRVLGMKQLPGRPGITYSSSRSCLKQGLRDDPDLLYFKYVVGKEVVLYERFFNEHNCDNDGD